MFITMLTQLRKAQTNVPSVCRNPAHGPGVHPISLLPNRPIPPTIQFKSTGGAGRGEARDLSNEAESTPINSTEEDMEINNEDPSIHFFRRRVERVLLFFINSPLLEQYFTDLHEFC